MPQVPNPVVVAKTPGGALVPVNVNSAGTLATATGSTGNPAVPSLDASGNVRVNPNPQNSALGVNAASVIKAAAGRVGSVNIITGGSTAGAIYDCLTTAAVGTTNQIATLPALTTAQLGVLTINSIAKVGITVIPGTGQAVSVFYE